MEIRQTIRVSREPAAVWTMLGDIPAVVACIPGAELGTSPGENRYSGSFKLKVGPLSAKIDGEGTIERNEAARTGRIVGRGIDKRGGSRVGVTFDYAVVADPTGSAIHVTAVTDLSGPLAQIGRTGIIEDVARRLTDEFSTALEARLGEVSDNVAVAAPPDTAVFSSARQFDAGNAMFASVKSRLVAFFRRISRR
jgi:carbon monoxide dehydrogenase subunit G